MGSMNVQPVHMHNGILNNLPHLSLRIGKAKIGHFEMKSSSVFLVLSVILAVSSPKQQLQLPSTYEYFTQGGIKYGLTADQPGFFKLNGKDIRIISGSIHSFRTHPKHWRTSLRKLRSLGANTVETYAPWNLHEPEKGVFDFGRGGRDFSLFLNVRKFVKMAKEEDLLVIFRPGPYIGTEWEYGGMPSWLLRDPNMKVRGDYGPWIEAVESYFNQLLPQVSDLEFSKGGPIVVLQVENAYGIMWPRSTAYLENITQIFRNHGFRQSVFFTNNMPSFLGKRGSFAGALMTANFKTDVKNELDVLKKMQPNRPIMVMEYWSALSDQWGDSKHSTFPANEYSRGLEIIFKDFAGSVNFYVFKGGTSFGFMQGSNNYPRFGASVTSYDFDGILTEAGDYTKKYYLAKDLITKYQVPALRKPKQVRETRKGAYGRVYMQEFLNYSDIIGQVPTKLMASVPKPIAMEELDINGWNGQSYGYIVYRTRFWTTGNDLGDWHPVSLKAGPIKDFGLVMINGIRDWEYWFNRDIDSTLSLSPGHYTLDIFVENAGRTKYGWRKDFKNSKKGLPNGYVSVNGVYLSGFEVIPLEFKSKWVSKLIGWKKTGSQITLGSPGPTLFRSTLQVKGRPTDTFLLMKGWQKGIVFINGFNIGRYWNDGPQKTLYVPGPFLRKGANSIVIFEHLKPGNLIRFVSEPDLG